MVPDLPSRFEAQRRADRIRAFREELTTLRAEDASPLTPEQESALAAHHDAVLAALASRFDVDRSERSGQLSKGMVLAALFGAAALIMAIYSLVDRAWWRMDLPAQTTLLTMFPLLSLGGVELAARREKTRYFAGIFALVACATAWLAIVLVARLLDLPFSVLLLWPGILFGVAVAVSYGFRVVFAISLVAVTLAIAGGFFAAGNVPWPRALSRLEPLMVTAFLMAAGSASFDPAGAGFGRVARIVGVVMGLGAMLALSADGGMTLLPLNAEAAEAVYQGAMLVASIACIWLGLRLRHREVVTIASALLSLFLLIRYVDWFWDVLPAWVFFLALAGLAFAALAILKRLRARVEPS